jgi:outer membrane protein assembly factor BamB
VVELAERDVPGGLVVQWGAEDLQRARDLVGTGRYLVHLLALNGQSVVELRELLQKDGLYGLIAAEPHGVGKRLPYTENLVNLFLVQAPLAESMLTDVVRVLCPHGIVMAPRDFVSGEQLRNAGFAVDSSSRLSEEWLVARKPWPDGMDEWTHPRHSATGNAVTRDTLVGPPRRVRWLAGPWAEVANLVTIDGRNIYGGVWARDGFNGLRLWSRDLAPSPSRGGFGFRAADGSMPTVTGPGRVFVSTEGVLQALDSRTGQTVRTYPEVGSPVLALYDQGMLVTSASKAVYGVDARSGRVVWTYDASEPRELVAGDGIVALLQGSARRGETIELVVLEQSTGAVRWRRSDLTWLLRTSRLVYHRGMVACEVSTLNDDGPGNELHIVSAQDGQIIREFPFLPGMNHMRQARAMFVDERLWLLQGGRLGQGRGFPLEVTALDVASGEELARYPAGLAHCFPPVATPNYLLSGEMDFTDLRSGKVDANRITKAACGRDAGWFLAHGLIYVTPKHCVCWPMLRGYAALAPERPGGQPAAAELSAMSWSVETGVASAVPEAVPAADPTDWPAYRRDSWRSSHSPTVLPSLLQTLWTAPLETESPPSGPVMEDWRDDPYCKGPVTPPVIADGCVYVARSHRHQVVALDAQTGMLRWQFTANGRVDTPPTIHRGLCLFGSRNGIVYCLRASDGQPVWQMQIAPLDERIVAYGQLESPWPVPGSVLVIDDTAYLAAGRQSFADGGILLMAFDPATGSRRWVQRLNTVPQTGYYTSSALEFDNFDLLFREGDQVAMARWVFDRSSGAMSVDMWKGFSRLSTNGRDSVMAPHGHWSYAPRNQSRTTQYWSRRPPVVFRESVLWGCAENRQSIYRRDFQLESGETFDTKWITGWANSDASRGNDVAWPSQRLAEKAAWKKDVYQTDASNATIDAMVLAGDQLLLAGSDGQLCVVSAADGAEVGRHAIPAPAWDGLAVARGRAYLTTRDGQVLCLGE